MFRSIGPSPCVPEGSIRFHQEIESALTSPGTYLGDMAISHKELTLFIHRGLSHICFDDATQRKPVSLQEEDSKGGVRRAYGLTVGDASRGTCAIGRWDNPSQSFGAALWMNTYMSGKSHDTSVSETSANCPGACFDMVGFNSPRTTSDNWAVRNCRNGLQ